MMEEWGLITGVVSLVLGAYAIWLSKEFYKMSNAISQEIQETSRRIRSDVEKLDRLFDQLYSDTFRALNETYSEMRQRLWASADGRIVEPVSGPKEESKPSPSRTPVGRPTPDPTSPLPPRGTDPPLETKIITEKRDRVGEILMELFHRAQRPDRKVTAGQLADLGNEAGLSYADAATGVIRLGRNGRLYPVGDNISIDTVLVSSKEEAERLKNEKLDAAVAKVLGEETNRSIHEPNDT
jgi:hypothetical protein